MRRFLLSSVMCLAVSAACDKGTPTGPGTVSVTKTTTTIAPATKASFMFSPTNPRAKQSIIFNGETSAATVGQTITKYAWNFGDGATDTIKSPTHSYALEGAYTVTLSVTDSAGKTDTAVLPVPVVGTVTTTTTTVVPTVASARFVNPSAAAGSPSDMSLAFELNSSGTYNVTGFYSTPGPTVLRGTVAGTMTGSLTPAVTGTFSGSLTSVGCVPERTRAFTGTISQVLLVWNASETAIAGCTVLGPASPFTVTLFKSEAPAALTGVLSGLSSIAYARQ